MGEQPVGEGGEGGGDLAGDVHQAEERDQAGEQDRQGGGHEDVQRLGDQSAAALFHLDREEGGGQGAEDAALAGGEGMAEGGDMGDTGEDDDGGDRAAEDRGAAEFPGGVEADEDGDERHEAGGDGGQRGDQRRQPAQVGQQAVDARDDAAADQGGDQRDEDIGDPAQEEFGRSGVLGLLARLEGRALGGEVGGGGDLPGRRRCCRCRVGGGRGRRFPGRGRRGGRGARLLGQALELGGDPGDRPGAQHDLVRVVLDHAHDARHRLEGVVLDQRAVPDAEAQAGHAVGDGGEVPGAADEGEQRGGERLVLVGVRGLAGAVVGVPLGVLVRVLVRGLVRVPVLVPVREGFPGRVFGHVGCLAVRATRRRRFPGRCGGGRGRFRGGGRRWGRRPCRGG